MVRVIVRTRKGSYKAKWKLEKHEWFLLIFTCIVALLIVKTLIGG